MKDDDRTIHLLIEILETQRAHLEEYKRVTDRSLEIQKQSFEAQARYIRWYRNAVVIGGLFILALLGYIVWLLGTLI